MTPTYSAQEQWRLLIEEGKTTGERRRLARLYALLPSGSRCRICNVPFTGLAGRVMRSLGRQPSTFNPHLCSGCDSFARTNPGGVQVSLSMLFADIRGSTSLAEQLEPAEFVKLIDRFYAAATRVLADADAIIDKLAGDQLSGYFVPGLVGPAHARVAVAAARALLQATGHGDQGGPWVPIGVGVHTGEAFIGAVGTQGGLTDITALGDAVNIAARLAAVAGPGEILASQDACRAAGLETDRLEPRELEVRGRSAPVAVYLL